MAKAADALADGKIDEIVIEDEDEAAARTKRQKQQQRQQAPQTTSTWSLPDGVEGVFEPSVAGTRLQGGQSVSAAGRSSIAGLKVRDVALTHRSRSRRRRIA